VTASLPAAAKELGGAIVRVLEWEQYRNLPAITTRVLGQLVAEYPELNTDSRIDLMADAAAFYGERFDSVFVEMIESYGVEKIYLAIDTLHEEGLRDRRGGDRLQLECLVSFLAVLEQYGAEAYAVPEVIRRVEQFGGFEELMELSVEDIERQLESFEEYAGKGESEERA
jgi:hypothetical protein